MTFGKYTGNSKPFHSSVYGKAANGQSIGAVSSQSFNERRQVERSRQAIGRYNDSFIAQRGGHLQDSLRHRIDSPQENDADPVHKGRTGRHWQASASGTREQPAAGGTTSQKLQVPPPRKNSFREPPARGFNPYG